VCYGDSEAYLVSAKLIASAVGPNVAPEIVRCQLHIEHASGSENDYAEGTVSSNASGDMLVSTLAMEYPVRTSGGTATVYCDAPNPAYASNVMLVAVHVGGVN
jgi:hypothetical protein